MTRILRAKSGRIEIMHVLLSILSIQGCPGDIRPRCGHVGAFEEDVTDVRRRGGIESGGATCSVSVLGTAPLDSLLCPLKRIL